MSCNYSAIWICINNGVSIATNLISQLILMEIKQSYKFYILQWANFLAILHS